MTDILIVDDNADTRRLIRVTLESEFKVQEAPDGATALALMRELHPAIVFLDVMMPGRMNGLQVLTEIREDPTLRETTVVMVTGRCEPSDVANARRHGADGYLVKPFSTLELLEWVRAQPLYRLPDTAETRQRFLI